MTIRRQWRGGRWTGALALWAVLGVWALVLASPATADDGLETRARSTYVLEQGATTVSVRTTIHLRNVVPDRGGVSYYFDGLTVPVPAGAQRVRARSAGDSLPVSLRRTSDPSTRLARIGFPRLRHGGSRTVTLSFEVPGAQPRARDRTRVGPGYATFSVYGVGDRGHNVVEVVAPASLRFDSTGEDFTAVRRGATTTYSSRRTAAGGGSWALVSLRDPTRKAERVVDVAGVSLLLDGFSDDPTWGRFVADRVTRGVPVLERLAGARWPGGLERIREDASPSLRGYDGWFDPSGNEIVIGERLDADLLFHELSHAWVSGARFDERWVYEGLAQVLAERAVAATGGAPAPHPVAFRGSTMAVALNAWGGSAADRSAGVDAYAYPAAYAATRALTGELSDRQLAAVVGAAIRGERAYDPVGTKDPGGSRTTWFRWLDLLETRAGVTAAPAVFAQWALTGKERAQLPARAKARALYAAVDRSDGAWLPPEGLRDAMTAWDFERARAVGSKVATLGPSVTALQTAARRTGIRSPDAARAAYEDADSDEEYTALASSLPRAAAAVTAVGAAQRAATQHRDPLSAIGARLLGTARRAEHASGLLAEGRYPQASAVASEATDRSAMAMAVGGAVVLLPVLLLLLGADVVLWARRRGTARGRRIAAQEAARVPVTLLGRDDGPPPSASPADAPPADTSATGSPPAVFRGAG